MYPELFHLGPLTVYSYGVLLATAYYRLKLKDQGDRERAIVARLNAENQAKQPGAKAADSPAPAASAPKGTTNQR